jgi:hypothetical protein
MEVEHKYYDLFISLCVSTLWDAIYSISKERCNGCEIDHPSQVEHSCLMDSPHMKVIMSFELAFMRLNIRDILHIMLREHGCDCAGIQHLYDIMKTYYLTDLWRSKIYSEMERDATSYNY